jgi:hypothetical protein
MAANQPCKSIRIPIRNESTEELPIGTFAGGPGENGSPEGGHKAVGWPGRHQENSKPRVRYLIALKLPGARKMV